MSILSAYFVFLFLKLIRSSYDRYERYIASPGYTGLTCPQGHRLLARLYKSTGRHCDMCETGFEEQHTGKCCKVRALLYDFCFIHESFRFATMTCAPRVCCWTLQSSPFRRPTPSMTSPFNRPTPSMSIIFKRVAPSKSSPFRRPSPSMSSPFRRLVPRGLGGRLSGVSPYPFPPFLEYMNRAESQTLSCPPPMLNRNCCS